LTESATKEERLHRDSHLLCGLVFNEQDLYQSFQIIALLHCGLREGEERAAPFL
jgi:hypothetical protein